LCYTPALNPYPYHMQISSSSAIPIWEFLTRNEKVREN